MKKRSSLIWRQHCWGSKPGLQCMCAWTAAATLFYAPPPCYFRLLPGVGWRMQSRAESRACMCTQCTMHRRATKKVQRTSSVYAPPWASWLLLATAATTLGLYDINRRRIEVRKPIKTHNPIFSLLLCLLSWCCWQSETRKASFERHKVNLV